MEKEYGILQNMKNHIIGNSLSIEEEYELWELLEQRIKENRKCIAVAIVEKVKENMLVVKYKDVYLNI